jgi:hypothetical protein
MPSIDKATNQIGSDQFISAVIKQAFWYAFGQYLIHQSYFHQLALRCLFVESQSEI